MTTILEVFENLIASGTLPHIDRVDLPARDERTTEIPEAYRNGTPGRWLMNDDKLQGRLWRHQALAMEATSQEKNVVVATGTASGKSLIFQSSALRILDMDDDATVLVFYPIKALASDQLISWRRIGSLAGLNDDEIVQIDGNVPRPERAGILSHSRIALLTPDICHAWLLQELSNVQHRDFLARISLVVIDEAHTLEGVFGSNFSYLFRRLCVARSLVKSGSNRSNMKVIAASATISNPKKHLEDLTGLEFDVVEENEDGSPSYPCSILHLGGQHGKEAETVAPYLGSDLIDGSDSGSFIAFIDSRQGAERLAVRSTEQDDVIKPYRSGYEANDRSAIENSLREGSLRGVVSTSALELGIDIPHFALGFNIGIPVSRKSFRQRLGRIGRRQRGSFAIVAEPFAFNRFGMTLGEYYRASVEPSYLYLRNRFMQYAHARCLAEELEMSGTTGRKGLPSNISWPKGFAEVFDFSYPNSPRARPREFDQVAQIGGDQPHFNYPLRNVPEEQFSIVDRQSPYGGTGSRIGQPLSLQQAIREAYPGAIHLHMATGWKVQGWQNTAFERVIRVSRTKSRFFPTPLIRTFVNFSIDRDSLIDNRYRTCETGFIAECQLQIVERVEGYREGDEKKLYKDLRSENPNMTPKTRDFRTSGVVIRIEEDWFREKGIKDRIANSLRDLMLREYSISPRDVDVSSTNVCFIKNGERKLISDAIVLFDSTHGSLHLTEQAYLEIENLLGKMSRSIDLTSSEDCLLSSDMLTNLLSWHEKLQEAAIDNSHDKIIDSSGRIGDWYHVFRIGSVVTKRDLMGVHHDIEVTGYELMDLGEGLKMFYSYGTEARGKAMLPMANAIPIGDNWDMVYWNSETGEVRDSIDDVEE